MARVLLICIRRRKCVMKIKAFVISALSLAVIAGGCTTPGKRTGIGAGAGAATGAAIGGAAGGWKGAGIGALAGAASGAAIGNYLDKQYKELERVADTKRLENGILVNLKNDLLFDVDSDRIRPQAETQLTEVGQILSKYKEDRIRIEGFTDSTGEHGYNQQLSERRAEAVRQVLLDQGVKDEQILLRGNGELKPIASNTSEKGRQKNRRVELYIDVPKDRAPAAVKAVD